METDHFVMLDALNTVGGNEPDRSYPYVQIVYPSIMNSYPDNKVTGSHPENGLKHKEREKHSFTITLSVDADYNAAQIR
jgi:hypothetical protein